MSTDELYESCLPILADDLLEDEDKTEKVEELLRQQSSLTGKHLETAVLDILWRHRNAGSTSSASPAITLRKSASPAPWQMSRSATPTASPRSSTASPAPTSINAKRPGLFRVKSSNTGSPFSSPRPSPSLLYAAPRSVQTPSPNPYDFTVDPSLPSDMYADYASDTSADWLVGDKVTAGGMSANAGYQGEFVSGADWVPSQAIEMGPYEILRSVLRDQRSDEEIEKVLEANAYDLSAAMASLMENQSADSSQLAEPDRSFLVGKSMGPSSRPGTPSGQAKSSVVCRYWLQTGQCLRADCKFSHDLSNHICKYWLQGNCLAGDSCIFSHDPSGMLGNLAINNTASYSVTPSDLAQPSYEIQDYESFPSLGATHPASTYTDSAMKSVYASNNGISAAASTGGSLSHNALAPEFVPSRPQSRPGSRHRSPAPASPGIALDDGDSFPTLGAAAIRTTKKHHGKRGHGHGHREKENSSNSLADVVRNAPNPPLQPHSPRRTLRGRGAYSGARENLAAVHAIPAPECIPWLETGDRANKAYLKARQDAIRHGNARNKFLQSAAQAWHRQDVRAAKALSLRGQSENDLMREAHRAAADALYEARNKFLQSASSSASAVGQETYIDLHGLHPAEAVSYLSTAISSQRAAHVKLAPRMSEEDFSQSKIKFLYAIVGTGHHSRSGGAVGTASGAGGKDKVGRAVRSYLSECGYAFKEFSAPQEQVRGVPGPPGGILGIDVVSGDASRESSGMAANAEEGNDSGIGEAEDGLADGNAAGSNSSASRRVKSQGAGG